MSVYAMVEIDEKWALYLVEHATYNCYEQERSRTQVSKENLTLTNLQKMRGVNHGASVARNSGLL